MVDAFLDYLEEINLLHKSQIPDYFNDAITKLEEVTSDESPLMKFDKMNLTKLMGNLKKYILHDVYGFNSGEFIN